MAAYTLTKHELELEINGEPLTVNYGDADMIDKLQEWSTKAETLDYTHIGKDQSKILQADVENFIRAMIGKEQFDRLKKAVGKWDLLCAVETLAILYHEVTTAKVNTSFKSIMDKYLPEDTQA